MIKNRLKSHLLIVATIIVGSLSCNIAAFAETAAVKQPDLNSLNQTIMDVKPISTEPASADEAIAVANQFNALSKSIKSNKESILVYGNTLNSINTTVINKVKAIIQIIEVQRKKLVDLITNESVANTSDPAKLDSIIHSLDTQRAALSDLISGERSSVSTQQTSTDGMTTVNTSPNKFNIYSNQ